MNVADDKDGERSRKERNDHLRSKQNAGIFFAILAAALYAMNAPFSKLLLVRLPPAFMAALLYLGAGAGMALLGAIGWLGGRRGTRRRLDRADVPYVAGMVALDIAAPVLLMLGLSNASAANVSLLNNFEIVATAVIAFVFFKEAVSPRLWLAIALVTLASLLLSVEDAGSFSFSTGSLFVLLACVCWGVENNCTRKLSEKDPMEIVVVKGIGSGTGALVTALLMGERITETAAVPLAMLLGFVAYGLSIFFYIRAQRVLGAAKTSAYYAIAPFIGAALALFISRERPDVLFWIALAAMAAGTYFASTDGQ